MNKKTNYAGDFASSSTPLTLLPPWQDKRRPERANTLLIRADATRHSGSGHVMRALALAHGWQAEGGSVVFATHCDSDALCDRIDAARVQRVALNAPHPDRADLFQTLALIAQHDPAWIVLDGYHFAPCYQQALQETGCPLLVVDDMAHLPRYHADILLNQNAYADTLHYACGEQTRLLCGPRYALLRPEFKDWQAWQRKTPQTAKNVLVTLGGADPDNVTQKAIHALSSWRGRDFVVKIVVGPANPHLIALQEAVAQAGRNISLLITPPDMPELMAWADIAITAGGTTSLELAFMQVPAVILVIADNQQRIADALDAAGAAKTLGWHADVSPQKLASTVHQLAHGANVRGDMARQGRRLVDGGGVSRVIKGMRGYSCQQLWQKRHCA
jgi:UDP-2,4-diacetamido-2,4,6-trideoxy-beta-L-altropyranose hydrolase